MEFSPPRRKTYVVSRCCQCYEFNYIRNQQGWDMCLNCGPSACNNILELERWLQYYAPSRFLRCCWCRTTNICQRNLYHQCLRRGCCLCNALHPEPWKDVHHVTASQVQEIKKVLHWLQLQRGLGVDLVSPDLTQPAMQTKTGHGGTSFLESP